MLQKLILVASFGLSVSAVHAQAPISFASTPEAVRRYEEEQLESLRARCEPRRATAPLAREEASSLKNGFYVTRDVPGVPGRYEIFVYDQDKRSFALIDGQRLGRDARLTLKLALPRDYARCRVVREPGGLELLELVHRDNNAPAEAQAMDKLLQDSQVLAAEARPERALACPASQSPERIVVSGVPLAVTACNEAAQALATRMTRTIRRLFER